MKTESPRPVNRKQKAELEALAALPGDRIDLSEAPEVRDWSDAKRGLFHRPVKK